MNGGTQYGPGADAVDGGLAQVDAIPEPQTWALMLIGFAGVGMALQRHRRSGRVLAA